MEDPNFLRGVIAILIKRIGGTQTISQKDLNEIAFSSLLEGWNVMGDMVMKVVEPEKGMK